MSAAMVLRAAAGVFSVAAMLERAREQGRGRLLPRSPASLSGVAMGVRKGDGWERAAGEGGGRPVSTVLNGKAKEREAKKQKKTREGATGGPRRPSADLLRLHPPRPPPPPSPTVGPPPSRVGLGWVRGGGRRDGEGGEGGAKVA